MCFGVCTVAERNQMQSAEKHRPDADQKSVYVRVQSISFRYYNMVGVAVAMVISTMHNLHNARKFEKGSKIQSFTHLVIAMMKLRKYHSHEFLKVSKLRDAIIHKALSYEIEAEFLFELT